MADEETIVAARSHAPEEIVTRGEAIYRDHIEPNVAPLERGRFVVIDVVTGDYEIDDGDAEATRRLLNRKPDAITYAVRVGYHAAYSHAGGFRIPSQDA